MSLRKFCIFLLILFFQYYPSHSQEVFHEIETGKRFQKSNSLGYFVDGNWRHSYTEEAWNKYGLSFSIRKDLKNNWSLFGGLDHYFVNDKTTANYYELRPWIQVSLKSRITNQIAFTQFLKTEWRNYFYNQYYTYDNYNRLRYRVHVEIKIPNSKPEVVTSLKPGIEWFILNNPSNGERYANSREYYFRYSIEKPEREIHLGYKFETFYKTVNPNGLNANTFFLEYKF